MDNPFSFSHFTQAVDNIFSTLSSPIAVFDADGTLWKEDVGFGFFNYQIEKNWIGSPQLKEEIDQLYQTQPQKSCSLIVQANRNTSFDQYQSWCQDYLKTHSLSVFSFQKEIIFYLKKKGVQLYVVTASPEWLVRETLQYYKLPIDEVVGVKTKIQNGIITDELQYPLPIASGKVNAYLQQSQGLYPFFVSGNTLSDLDLLETSTHLRLVVESAQKGEKHFDSERVLLSLSKQKSWFYKDLLEDQ